MGETFLGKTIASVCAAIAMYWMYIPPSYAVIVALIAMDMVLGGALAIQARTFKVRKLYWGLFVKSLAFPMAWICDQVQGPLHIGFDLKYCFLLWVMGFEFLSVIQGYAKLGGPGAVVLLKIREKVVQGLTNLASDTRVNETQKL